VARSGTTSASPYNVSVTETVALVHNGVLFNLTIDNASSLPVGETYFPMIGGIQAWALPRSNSKPLSWSAPPRRIP